MKKQIIAVSAVVLAIILLVTSYFVFFRKSDDTDFDEFYRLSDEVKAAIGEIGEDTEIELRGYSESDAGWQDIYKSASCFASASKKVKVKTASGAGDVRIGSDGGEVVIAYGDFFETLYDGTRYAFNGEPLIANAILKCNAKPELAVEARAYSGYDIDGDIVTASGAPFVFKSLDRSEISLITVNNENGKYSVYQNDGSFYFSGSAAVAMNSETFSLITTNMRYPVSVGKMKLPEGRSWKDYGLESEADAAASYTIMSEKDSSGRYFLHTVYIGGLSGTKSYYYARYIGGLFADNGGESEMVVNLSKDIIYYISASVVTGSLMQPETAMMDPTLIKTVSSANDIYYIDDIRIDIPAAGINAHIRNMSAFIAASNLSANDNSALSKLMSDKVYAEDYSKYADGWTNHADIFGGFSSSDGGATYIEAVLARNAADGKYSVSVGLLRDEAAGAYLPRELYFTVSDDGVNYKQIGETLSPAQEDKTIKRYTLEFESENAVKYIRVCFDVPQVKYSYVVMDEIHVTAGGIDAQPSDSLSGVWRLVNPQSLIPEGRNFAYLDMTNFGNFVQSIASLKGDSVVACGIGKDGDAKELNTELLAKYGLDNPAKHFSFVYKGEITVDLYVSEKNENGNYYVYNTYYGVYDGKDMLITPDIICEISPSTAAWLDWDMTEYIAHPILSIYLVEISEMTFEFGGNKYDFRMGLDSDGSLASVRHGGKEYDVLSFKYLFQDVLSVYLEDKYTPGEGELGEEYLRIEIKAKTRDISLVFYRVSASKCYFTVDGSGGYYTTVESVNTVRDDVLKYLDGQTITRR